MTKLKPCPFCGGEARIMLEEEDRPDDSFYNVYCTGCGAQFWVKAKSEAITVWNRRAQPDNDPKECPAMERVEGGIPYCADKQTACDGCHCAQPANDPLTLEQLREMHGQPVWVVPNRGIAKWYLVDVANDCCSTCDMDVVDFELYGPKDKSYGWLAYHRPPEGSENDGL